MKNLNIPIYRAKKIDSDEYAIGFFHSRKWDGETRTEYYITYESLEWEIDPTTLSISFPDMLDSQGNKIFASLNEDGKGGDICDLYLFKNQDKPTRENYTCRYKNQKIMFKNFNFENYAKIEIIGIQK